MSLDDRVPKITDHYDRVRTFMILARQHVRNKPEMPTQAERELRARLILEEALETIEALGFEVMVDERSALSLNGVLFDSCLKPDLEEIADGCADLSVVTTGTLLACGIADVPLLKLVDENNLAKFGEGHSWSPEGKLLKPPGHKKPDIAGLLKVLGA